MSSQTFRIIALLWIALSVGCADKTPPATMPVALDPATTQPAYWLDQPGPTVVADDFDKLWNASESVARDLLFTIDRTDYRGGLLTTEPMISKQWFEFWRGDVLTADDLADSSLTNTRRIMRFEFERNEDGTFSVTPKVLIERQSLAEQRITSVVNYRGVFRQPTRVRDRPRGTRESDEGILLPNRYWYVIGRDTALEQHVASRLRRGTTG